MADPAVPPEPGHAAAQATVGILLIVVPAVVLPSNGWSWWVPVLCFGAGIGLCVEAAASAVRARQVRRRPPVT